MSDYSDQLARIHTAIEASENEIVSSAEHGSEPSLGQITRHLSLSYQYFSLTGDLVQLSRLREEALRVSHDRAVHSDLGLLKVHLALKLHRFAEAEDCFLAEPDLARSSRGRLVQAELDVQQGRYAEALLALTFTAEDDIEWERLCRLACLAFLRGDLKKADELYATAQDELTAKQMQSFAWIEVQRGVMDFQRGRYAEVLLHYQRAEKAYSGYWLVAERTAELAGALGDYSTAITEYEKLYVAQPKPEWAQAIGELHSLSGAIGDAHRWKLRALEQYHASVSIGEAHYLSYLIDICCELEDMRMEAIGWARKDEAIRSNYQTMINLAWALHRNGKPREAMDWSSKALETGVVSPRLYLQAACIYFAGGELEQGSNWMRLSRTLNPTPAKARLSWGSLQLPR